MNKEIKTRMDLTSDTISLARQLLGQILAHDIDGVKLSGRIVETEAYLGHKDKACHTYGGRRTARTEAMYLPAGYAYVYLIYGMYHCLNVVSSGEGEAVLIRSIQPLTGVEKMRINRPKAKTDIMLANGPGKLCMALQINKTHNAHNLFNGGDLSIQSTLSVQRRIISTPRIGVDYAKEWKDKPLRFVLQ